MSDEMKVPTSIPSSGTGIPSDSPLFAQMGDEDTDDVEQADSDEGQSLEQTIAAAQDALREGLGEKGVSLEQLNIWKGTYGRIASFPIYETLYVIRPLTRKEWRMVMKEAQAAEGKTLTNELMEERIAAAATLFPALSESDLRTSSYAGVATSLSNAIQMISGFQPGSVPIVL
jgi:hypothetical protein